MNPDDALETLTRLTKDQRAGLKRLRIATIRDLLYHFPARYESSADVRRVSEAGTDETVTLYGTFTKLEMKKSFRTKVPMTEGSFSDGTGTLRVVWFHQPYLAKMIPVDALVRISGKVTERNGKKYIANPAVEKAAALPYMELKQEGMLPVYPETAGITSLWIFHAIKWAIENGVLDHMDDPLPPTLIKKYHLPVLKSALIWIHQPKREQDAKVAQKRFAFEEVFLIQLKRALDRKENQEKQAYEIDADEARVAGFMASFPFKATGGQKKAIADIMANFLEPYPMARLLEGDVGSGKTAVAAATAFAVATSRPKNAKGEKQTFGNLQVAYMCPTEILAQQHFATFTSFFNKHPIHIGLITSSGCYKFPSKTRNYAEQTRNGPQEKQWVTPISRAQLLKWVQNGEIPILIGTHALIQKSVQFKHLAYVIIDEQHRFGTAQRYALARSKTEKKAPGTEKIFDPLLYRDLTYRIRTALFNVKKTLGSGHKEIIYQRALAEEFTRLNIPFSQEVRIPVTYRTKVVGTYVPDFVVDEKVIVELKALPFTGEREKKQLWNYLKGSDYCVALLANFSPQELTITRVVYESARSSASVPRSSAQMDPHLLSMTATPIPRTLALTIYGDLDLTILDELPAGRKEIKTEITPPARRAAAYEKIRELLKEGRQAYVICPRIDEPDPGKSLALQARSVASEAKRLAKEIFPEYSVGILHSKMTPKEKEESMMRFEQGTVDILVATSVVEVGVNVPNATVIMIEGADRFGLAQLHQLRGRVQRSAHQPYCFLMVEKSAGANNVRLKAIVSAKNGFELAEKDLAIRGAGELYGRKQWGLSDIGMNALQNLKLVEAARKEAGLLVEKDPILSKHPLLRALAEEKSKVLHFE